MKSIASPLQTEYNSAATHIAFGLHVVRHDGAVYGFTNHDKDVTISLVVYDSGPGMDITDIVVAAGSAVGSLEVTTVHDGTIFTTKDIHNGLWENAAFAIFKYNWASPTDGVEFVTAGTIGTVTTEENQLTVEMRDLRQYLQNPVGSLTSITCRDRFGGPKCRMNLAPLTVTGSVTGGISANVQFVDSARTEADDWFGEGEFQWLTGNNAGSRTKVIAYGSDTFTLMFPMFGSIQVGDTYRVIAGCRKRFVEDCHTKFNNRFNFYGEPHIQGPNKVIAPPGIF